jgi:TPR repeat protein
MPTLLTRGSTSLLAALGLFTCLVAPAAAAPVDITFLPPDIPAQEICLPKKADSDVVARWSSWDGSPLTEGNPDEIMRDARRLRDLGASRNFDLAMQIIDAVSAMKGVKIPDTTIDRIGLYLGAGKIPQLKQAGLIEKLEANDAALAPKALNLLGDIYLDGTLGQKDAKKGLRYLVRAATGGNADALLRLAALNVAGQQVEGWTLDPKLATTMAFGALVGKLDPEICDRIGRIAREYSKGEVVAQNYEISEKWQRLAADLGDGNAAWKVAQLHLASENITKDNDALLKYLKLAANRGVAGAQVELGKLYEFGTLLDEDAKQAESWYAKAAELGNRNALFRLATMFERDAADPAMLTSYHDALSRLSHMPQAPGWAFSKLADLTLEQKGRWAGEEEARALLEKAVALGDSDAAQELAVILLRHRDDPGVFERATELLSYAVETGGKIDAMTELRQAYLCRAPAGVELRLAGYWQNQESAAGNSTRFMTPDDVSALSPDQTPLELARLQTHALYGRPNSVAYYLDFLEKNGASPEMIAFWKARIDAVPETVDAVARFSLSEQPSQEAAERSLAALKDANEAGLSRAPVDLADVLLNFYPNDPDRRQEAIAYLEEAAETGNGDAILRLLPIFQENGLGAEDLFARYANAIEARGDADALVFAANVTHDLTKRRDYLFRAASVVDCTFENTIKLAGAFVATSDDAETEHWLQVSLQLAGKDGWRHVAVADRYMAMGGEKRAKVAIGLYEHGVELGDDTAVGRLVKIYADPDGQDYAPTKAIAMFKRMVETAKVDDLGNIRSKIDKAPTAIRTALAQEIDWRARYAAAASSNDPIAMRELGLYLRQTGKSAQDAADASQWFRRAAEGGDVAAMVELAKSYAMGLGLSPSYKEARLWLEDAAGKGNLEASQLLASMSTSAEN